MADRSLEAKDRDVVVAVLNRELTVKRLSTQEWSFALAPENPNYPPIDVTAKHTMEIWGVVTNVIQAL